MNVRLVLLAGLAALSCHPGSTRGAASDLPDELVGSWKVSGCDSCTTFLDPASTKDNCSGSLCQKWLRLAPHLVLFDETKTVQAEVDGDRLDLHWQVSQSADVHHLVLEAVGSCQ